MEGKLSDKERFWQAYSGPNLGYVMEQYDRYAADPASVEPAMRELFGAWGAPESARPATGSGNAAAGPAGVGTTALRVAAAAGKLVANIRAYGHLAANIDPLALTPKADTRLLEPQGYGLRESELEAIPADVIWEHAPAQGMNAREAIERLRVAYTGTTAYEFAHVHEEHERDWLNEQVEKEGAAPLSAAERVALLGRLVETEQFEQYLQMTFVGQKRFSAEGIDAMVPLLDEAVRELARQGCSQVMIGMAHRGRLNVLAHILGKPYANIFAEFHHAPNKALVPSEGSTGINFGWSGDVKYHLGARRSLDEGEGHLMRLVLANNPSHLEFVNPVVQGYARAAQDDRGRAGAPQQNVNKAAAILIHGDAAFAGEGVVAEALNLGSLRGFNNGGSIHVIANNGLGFTTDSEDGRSTHYASDLAKGFEIPIVHVNADDPEACLAAVRLACAYRSRFRKDFLIDLIGYRRYGHNESDDPETTQPLMYAKVREHQTAAALYAAKLIAEGTVTEAQAERLKQDALAKLQAAYDAMRGESGEGAGKPPAPAAAAAATPAADGEAKGQAGEPATAVPEARLRAINDALLLRPQGFTPYAKLQRILERRAKALEEDGAVDWGHAETLAFAAIVQDGTPIRLSGQDTQRGTFAHRQLVLHDAKTGGTFCPLHALPEAAASFAIYNSPLSEAAVLGFEYGYNVYAPETFVIWEAQYGDFANAGQVIIDQFLAAGRSKWRQPSSLTLLLPHGYEGQGPEHSSARLERYLQLSGENNWTVVNLTRAAQYFHLLRRQAALIAAGRANPLIVMAPKSLIRHPRVSSSGKELTEGTFLPIVERPGGSAGDAGQGQAARAEQVERIVLCSGKVAIDLEEAMAGKDAPDYSWLHVIRVEQLYPFPEEAIAASLRRFANAKELVWLQEEPRNMGAWRFMEPRLDKAAAGRLAVRYAGRRARASTASGFQQVHGIEQNRLIADALNRSLIGQDR
ncbi:MAG: 2-oxoglutarate dehydrogenase E1 component [Paenibacillaceae bacterium]|nr:2-oxoglutarate dehydrogenase E1 component [Paenibacillaceae bacterium]